MCFEASAARLRASVAWLDTMQYCLRCAAGCIKIEGKDRTFCLIITLYIFFSGASLLRSKIDTELTIVVPPSAQHSVISSSGSSYSTSVRNTCYHTFIIINTRTCSPGLQHSFFYFFCFLGGRPPSFVYCTHYTVTRLMVQFFLVQRNAID